jgi:hypothetical protein
MGWNVAGRLHGASVRVRDVGRTRIAGLRRLRETPEAIVYWAGPCRASRTRRRPCVLDSGLARERENRLGERRKRNVRTRSRMLAQRSKLPGTPRIRRIYPWESRSYLAPKSRPIRESRRASPRSGYENGGSNRWPVRIESRVGRRAFPEREVG